MTAQKAPQIIEVDIDDLIPYARNSRNHSDTQIAQIAESIDRFGMVGAIVVRDGVIAKGHGTLSAIRTIYDSGKRLYPPPGREQGAEPFADGMVPVLDASGWTEAQFRAFVIADNKIAEHSGWDQALYDAEVAELMNFDLGLEALGFEISDNEAPEEEPKPAVETGPVRDVFWINIVGPLRNQADVLDRLRAAMADIEPVTVEMGTVNRD